MKASIQTLCLTAILLGNFDPFAYSIAAAAAASAAMKAPAKNQAMQRLFRRGVDAYDAKSYDDAVDVLSQLLKKEPDYLPARIQLARSLYQLKRFPEAYKIFQQIDDISLLEPDPSYEYGQTAFRANDFAIALKAFRNVPNGHPLFDLAGYYGGIAAFKLADYQNSLDLFSQAVVLPSKLVKSQKLYQKEAERLITLKQKQDLANIPVPASPPPRPVAVPEEAPEPKLFHALQLNRGIRLEPRGDYQNHKTFDNRSSDHRITTGLLALDLGEERGGLTGRGPHWLLQSNLSVKGMEGSSGLELINPDAQAEQDQLITLKDPPNLQFNLEPSVAVEWPMGMNSSFGVQTAVRGMVQQGRQIHGSVIPHMNLFLAQKNNSMSSTINIGIFGLYYDDVLLFTNPRQSAQINFLLPNHFQIGLQGELSEYTYVINRVDGPNWQGRVVAEFSYGQEQGSRLVLGGFYETSEGRRIHDRDPAPIIEFNDIGNGAFSKIEINFLHKITLGLEAKTLNRSYSGLAPINSNSKATLIDAYPASVSSIEIYTNIFTGF